MTREDAKGLTLSILVVVVLALAADCVWLHCQMATLAENLEARTERIAVQERQQSASDVRSTELGGRLAALETKVERHLNPPPRPTIRDRAKETYDQVKAATRSGYEAVKSKILK